MTQIEASRKGLTTDALRRVAEDEGVSVDELREQVASGRVVIPLNPHHTGVNPVGIGRGLRTKINVNLGTSDDFPQGENELEKVDAALRAGADAVMDLSTGGDITAVRRKILERTTVPLGTVPIYQAAIRSITERGSIVEMKADDLFEVIEQQAEEGVDFMTVHAGLTTHAVSRLRRQGRVADIVSRGGSFHLALILHTGRENPLYEQFDRLLDIARSYDITLSLGDGLRPGALADATDRPQIEELLTLGELVQRAWDAGVQVMVEGPGHVPLDQIEMNVKLQKRLCLEAPFYVLGPLVTDIAPGYDHIVAAIGGAVAAAAGADFLCYVTPSEHLGLPTVEDVRLGTIASRIAAHAADIVKGVKGAAERDHALSTARRKLDWESQRRLALDPERFDAIRSRRASKSEACSMCGEFCALRIVRDFLKTDEKGDS